MWIATISPDDSTSLNDPSLCIGTLFRSVVHNPVTLPDKFKPLADDATAGMNTPYTGSNMHPHNHELIFISSAKLHGEDYPLLCA